MSLHITLIEQIKQSDIKICNLTKQIKEMESEIKKTENEVDIIRVKNKQLLQDIKNKKKVVDDKYNEIDLKQKEYDVLSEMMTEKRKLVEEAEKNLEEVKKKVFESRIKFTETSKNFVEENDFLVANAQKIEDAVRKREEEWKFKKEIEILETDLLRHEVQLKEINNELEKLEQAEKCKQSLENEPENGEEFREIRSKIEQYEEELEDLDMKYNIKLKCMFNQTVRSPVHQHPDEVHFNYNDYRSLVESNENSNLPTAYSAPITGTAASIIPETSQKRLNSMKERKSKSNFTPKMPSGLTRKNLLKNQDSNKTPAKRIKFKNREDDF